MLGRYEAAVRDFDRAIELDPADDDVYYQRGMARVELGEYLKAVEDFAQASMLNPDHPQAEAEREFAFDLAQSAGVIRAGILLRGHQDKG